MHHKNVEEIFITNSLFMCSQLHEQEVVVEYVLLMIPGKTGEPSLLFVKGQLHSSVYIRINFRSIHTNIDVLGTFEVLKRNKRNEK